MKNKRFYTGYAVVSKDILDNKKYKKGAFGVSLTDRNFETCKKYCRIDQVVVQTYRIVLSKSITFKWIRKYPCFSKSRRRWNPHYIQLLWLRIEWETIHTNEYERTVIYEKEKRRSENID